MKVDVYKVIVTWEVIAESKVDASGTVATMLGKEEWEAKSGVKVGDPVKLDVPDQSPPRTP